MKRLLHILLAFCALSGAPGRAQTSAPQSPASAVSAGTVFDGTDYNACAGSGTDYPCLAPWTMSNTVTHRFNRNDQVFGLNLNLWHQHGGSNFLGGDIGLPNSIRGNFMNYSGLTINSRLNTDNQGGGNLTVNSYAPGHGDDVMFTGYNRSAGCSRGPDECNELFRVFVEPMGDLWGISIASMTSDLHGQEIFRPNYGPTGIPDQLAGHKTDASTENGVIIDTSKVISGGNASLITYCPSSFPNHNFYTCVILDSAVIGATSNVTTLTTAISDGGPVDPFASGPVCTLATVASPAGISAGSIVSISSAGDNYEQITVLSMASGGFNACFGRPHAAGEVVSVGGGVGYALSMSVDDIAPHTLYGIDNENATTLHIAFPIVATLPGNMQVVWTNAAATQGGSELRTHAFDASTPVAAAQFTPVISRGILTSFKTVSNGNYFVDSKANTGTITLPNPAITFAGTCTGSMPIAHTVALLDGNNSQQKVTPIIDSPGSGCGALTAKVQSVYPNPVKLYPMVYARSNRDPNFVTTFAANLTYLKSVGVSASTNGYMVAGSGNPAFAKGDAIEFGFWWQHFVSSQINLYNPMGKSGRNGDWFNTSCTGIFGNACGSINNNTDPAWYYGTLASNWGADLLGHGHGPAPIGWHITGPISNGVVMNVPRTGVGTLGSGGTAIRVACDPMGQGGVFQPPCRRGRWDPYDLIAADARGDVFRMILDPNKYTVTPMFVNHPISWSVETLHVNQFIDLTGSTNAPPACTAAVRGRETIQFGYAGQADRVIHCLKNADETYSWR